MKNKQILKNRLQLLCIRYHKHCTSTGMTKIKGIANTQVLVLLDSTQQLVYMHNSWRRYKSTQKNLLGNLHSTAQHPHFVALLCIYKLWRLRWLEMSGFSALGDVLVPFQVEMWAQLFCNCNASTHEILRTRQNHHTKLVLKDATLPALVILLIRLPNLV